MKWILVYVVSGLVAAVLSAPSQLASASKKQKGCENKEADVIFMIDASRSISSPDFDKQLRFVRGIVRQFDVSDSTTRFGVLSFSDTAHVAYGLDAPQNRSSLAHAIVNVAQTLGTTRIDDALVTAGYLFARSTRDTALKIAVVLTDGQSDYPHMTLTEAAALHLAGVRVLAVGIGKNINHAELIDIAQMESHVFTVDSFNQLRKIRQKLTSKICELGTSGNNEMNTPPTKGCGGKPAEVVFALDASGSIWGPDFTRQLSFVKDLVGAFQVSPQMTRIGVLTFGDVPVKEFYLDRYEDNEQMTLGLSDIKQTRGGTNTGEAIDVMTKEFFSPKRTRDNVVKIGIVITDGMSDYPEETAAKAEEARNAGITMFSIGVGQGIDETELAAIANKPLKEYMFTVNNYNALNTIKEMLSMKACKVTLPPTTTTTTTTTSTTTTTTTTTTPAPTTTPQMVSDEGCGPNRPADVIFSLPPEASPAKTSQVFGFIRNVSSKLKVAKDMVRVGVVPRECYPLPGFALNSAKTKKEALLMFNTEPFRPAKTAQIIKYMRRQGFVKENGGRRFAKKIGILVIDSNSPNQLAATAKQARLARKQNIELFVVAVGKDVSSELKHAISGPFDSWHVFSVNSYYDLHFIASKVARNVNTKCLE